MKIEDHWVYLDIKRKLLEQGNCELLAHNIAWMTVFVLLKQ